MSSKIFTLTSLLFLAINSWSQNYNLRIEGLIMDYDGTTPLHYSFSKRNDSRERFVVQPDSLGRFLIQKNIEQTMFFRFYFQNKNQSKYYHNCRLIVQPNNSYCIVSEGTERTDERRTYSPDVYISNIKNDTGVSHLKLDLGQVYYNLIDDWTMGSLYHEDWDLYKPELLIDTLNHRINKQVSLFTDLLNKGEIDSEFFEIAKANVEHFTTYQLIHTITDSWVLPRYFGISDTTIVNQLIEIHSKLFELYPIENANLEKVLLPERYIGVYLFYYECYKSGKFEIPAIKGSWLDNLDSIKHLIPYEVYRNYKLRHTLSATGGLELGTLESTKKFIKDNSDMAHTYEGQFLINDLIPRYEHFDSLANRLLPDDCVFLDDIEPITSFQQLTERVGRKPFLIDFWGTWCGPCREQYKYNDQLKIFLKENDIEMVYIAHEYNKDRDRWKKVIAAYNLTGYHLMTNQELLKDFKSYGSEITGFPTYMIVNENGQIVESNAYPPSYGEKLLNQISEKLNITHIVDR